MYRSDGFATLDETPADCLLQPIPPSLIIHLILTRALPNQEHIYRPFVFGTPPPHPAAGFPSVRKKGKRDESSQ